MISKSYYQHLPSLPRKETGFHRVSPESHQWLSHYDICLCLLLARRSGLSSRNCPSLVLFLHQTFKFSFATCRINSTHQPLPVSVHGIYVGLISLANLVYSLGYCSGYEFWTAPPKTMQPILIVFSPTCLFPLLSFILFLFLLKILLSSCG